MPPDLPIPIPLGSPHAAKPPMFDRWGLLSRNINRQDRRIYSRRHVKLDVWLIDVASQTVLRCKANDISDAGLHATSPIGYGLAVGQRFEARIANTNGPEAKSPYLAPCLGYVTIVRVEFDLERPDRHRIGFALRFDVPQLVPV